MKPNRQRFLLEIEDVSGYDLEAEHRLRSFLKIIGRRFGFKCLKAKRVPAASAEPVSTEEKERSERKSTN